MRPIVDATATINGRGESVQFSIDTGSDYTILQPRAALAVLGTHYADINFEEDRSRFDIYGVSGRASGFVIRTATLAFASEEDELLAIDLPILIARPSTPQPTPDSNWEAPSLLGQDALRSFDLALSYNPPGVSLTEAAHA